MKTIKHFIDKYDIQITTSTTEEITIQLVKYIKNGDYITLFFDVCAIEELSAMMDHCYELIRYDQRQNWDDYLKDEEDEEEEW